MFKYHLSEVKDIAEKLIQKVSSNVLLFDGSMGSGKTTLIKAIVKCLGSEDEVSSPTFSIVNEYQIANGQKVYHFDLYRLESLREALDFGIEDYLSSGSWCLIEWPDILKDYLDTDYDVIELNINENQSRSLELKFNQHNNTPNHVL